VTIRLEVVDESCGMKTLITISKISNGLLSLDIQTDCQHIKRLFEAVGLKISKIEAVKPFSQNIIYLKAAERMAGCIPCAVPCAIIKALWAELGMTLPKDAKIHFEK
jgi:predicted xylose isomerase-like sugar epimerase